MLTIRVPGIDLYNEELEEFSTSEEMVVELEHSLVSLSKWEEIYEKPFLDTKDKTIEEVMTYIRCMIITPGVPDDVFGRLSSKNVGEIDKYINAKRSATWFSDSKNTPRQREVITTELIYYWMVSFQIPFECQTWHLNRLLTLIKIFSVKNAPPKKMSKNEMAARNRELNARRRQQLNTSG